jgi:hypothetical protein
VGNRIVGLTPIGRAIIWLLRMHSPGQLELRATLRAAGKLRGMAWLPASPRESQQQFSP